MRRTRTAAARAALRLAAALLLALAARAPAQVADGDILLADGDPLGVPDYPFGITMDPDGMRAYIAVAGNYGSTAQANRRLVAIDPWTRAILGEAQTGLFPEDIAITRDAQGNARHLFVTCSTSGTVSVLTPALQPVATIPLPACPPFATSYPFGIAANAAGTRLLVTTLGGCGDVFVIDSDPQSPAFATVVATHFVPDGHGRPLELGPTFLVPTSVYGPGFSLSQGAVALVDPAPGAGATQFTTLTPVIGGVFVATVDSARLPNGNVLLTMNGEPFPRLYEYDPAAGATVRTIPLGAGAGSAIHGLAISPDGRLAVATSQDAQVLLFVDLAAGQVLATVPTGVNSQPNEVAFTRDGSRLFATFQTQPVVRSYRALPLRDLRLDVAPTAALGSIATLALSAGDWGSSASIFFSAGPGPTQLGPLTIALSEPFYLLGSAPFDLDGRAAFLHPVPSAPPQLSGVTVFLQAATVDRDGTLRLSNPAWITLQ